MVVEANTMVTAASQLSVAVGIAGAGTALHCTVTFAGIPANTGAWVSITVTVWETEAVLPQLSVAVHTRRSVYASGQAPCVCVWLNATLTSYHDHMDFGFVANAVAIDDLPELARHTLAAYEELKVAAGRAHAVG